MEKILEPYNEKGFHLKNRVVMAPMTRSRAIGNIPNELMAEYYGQRSGAGLIITEGVAPAPEALGYARIPGVFSQAQVEGWKLTADAVHAGGSQIFMQLMHTGRIGHAANLPEGYSVVGVSTIAAAGSMWTDASGMQPHPAPVALTTEGVKGVIEGFVQAAKNAVDAGFDGVELHSANGYLLEQFLNPNVNNRTDEYGGSIANRSRAILEVAEKTAAAIGKEKVAIRFSPYNTFNDLAAYDKNEVHDTYVYLAKALNELGIAYIHINMNAEIPQETYAAIREAFSNTIILCGNLSPETAETALHNGIADLVAFARHYLANPDLVVRIAQKAPLQEPDFGTAYTPGAVGYTDYATL